jgi:hypothetical protein
MRAIIYIVVSFALLFAGEAGRAGAQPRTVHESPAKVQSLAQGGARTVDGVAARIEGDIITESEVRELSAFQLLVDGKSKPRSDVINELADQWIVRGEAKTELFASPSKEDVDRAYQQFVKQFPSADDFKTRCAAAGLSDAAVRRLIEEQLYLSRFLDYRFRPQAQVEQQDIETYFEKEFVPQLKAHNQAVPSVESVADTIREVLIQRAINDNSTKWLDDTRGRLRIDVIPEGTGS